MKRADEKSASRYVHPVNIFFVLYLTITDTMQYEIGLNLFYYRKYWSLIILTVCSCFVELKLRSQANFSLLNVLLVENHSYIKYPLMISIDICKSLIL